MRIVIDLDSAAGPLADANLALARDIARGADANEVWIALAAGAAAPFEQLRHEFAGLVPPERVVACQLPSGAAWSRRAAAPVRENFLAGLAPDLVFAPQAARETSRWYASVAVLDRGADPWVQFEAAIAAHRAAPPPARPRLAYVSPLPPLHSGIADYSAELVPELARHYDVELIVDQPEVAGALASGYSLRQLDWFERHAHEFDRVLYHFGNSGVHRHMFGLIRRVPGIVVLHDFFLSGVLDNLETEGYLPHGYLSAMFESHGYSGLQDLRRIGRNPSIWKYPLNKGVLDSATGVIVHSEFSKQLARQWYGQDAANGWRTVPLLRGKQQPSDRDAARARVGLASGDYMVCSFGMLGRIKLNEELLDAFLASPLAADPRCRLVFVGANDPGPYGAGLARKIAASAAAGRIAITGFVDAGQYADYAAACDCAVQLRTSTRGETSAAVLDCLLHGAPTIVNAHGANAEIDDALLLKIPDAFGVPELAAALARLHGDAGLRDSYRRAAGAYMAEHHAPERVGASMAAAIEDLHGAGRATRYTSLVAALGAQPGEPNERELADCALAIALNQPPSAPRQLFVDVSAMVQSDLKTGIQRVVRSVLLALIAEPPPGFRIEPVYSHGGNTGYLYAHRYALDMLGETALALDDAPIELRRGDVFLGLDLFTNGTVQNEAGLLEMRQRGVQVYFVVYDLLPVLRPEVFPFGTEGYFGEFLTTVAKVADGVVCISRAVADEFEQWLLNQPARRLAPLDIGWFHLGADIHASAPTSGLPPNAQQVFDAVAARPTFLMVGTLEPRKGQAQALAAIELLWDQDVDVNLVVVGKQGWMVEQLAERLAGHQESGRRLFWLPGVSDEMLLALYARSSALLAASEGEGFGLPLIEAARHAIPILARDLPVFREVAGDHALYFSGLAPAELAAALNDWLALHRDGGAPASSGMPSLDWHQSAHQLLDAVVRQRWYKRVPGS